MSTQFNFSRARKEWALPKWRLLPDAVRNLYIQVQHRYENTHQRKDLGLDELPWIAEAFDAIEPALLAHAMQVIYALGHWDEPKKNACDGVPRDKHGGYWKFEMLAKQSLIRRKYVWKESDPAKDYMDHVEGTDYDDDELTKLLAPEFAPSFHLVKVTRINYRPHPFVIGLKHFPKDGGMFINVHQAGCDHCGRPYEEHTSDRVAILRPSRVLEGESFTPTPDEQVKLRKAAPLLEKWKLDGVVFTK